MIVVDFRKLTQFAAPPARNNHGIAEGDTRQTVLMKEAFPHWAALAALSMGKLGPPKGSSGQQAALRKAGKAVGR